jgi:methylthioribose-1-phosphate isomerase
VTTPLRYEDGALLVLDQRLLPGREEWIRCTSAQEVAGAIAVMAVRGAPAIGLAAAYGLALASREAARCAEEATIHVDEAARVLGAARPTASNLAWALERGRRELGAGRDLLDLARELEREQLEADRALSEVGAQLFEPGDRALTHCNTGPLATGGYGTALGVLRTADVGHVWVNETRPLLQGARLTAWELERLGIPYTVIADSAAGSLMASGEVDRVVVGADRIAANGDVANKIGTYPVAVLAARHGIPFYVAAPLSTIDPATPDGSAIPIEQRDPAEVAFTEGQPAANPAFDLTPAELITAIFTEAGMLEPPYPEAIARVAR